MSGNFQRFIAGLDVEERILNGAALFAIVSIFLPWFSGGWLGDEIVSFSGFGFYTSFMGWIIFILLLSVIIITFGPLFGMRIFRRQMSRDVCRLCLSSLSSILSIMTLSVLMKVTYDYTSMNIRFGIYCTLIGSVIATFYSVWKMQSHRTNVIQEVFQHPDDHQPSDIPDIRQPSAPPPPPPRPLGPEEHRLHR